jgi:hypothetical protein
MEAEYPPETSFISAMPGGTKTIGAVTASKISHGFILSYRVAQK